MKKNRFNLRNVVAIVTCLTAFSAGGVLAQNEVVYTDASGVTCRYTPTITGNGAQLAEITNLPASVTKWVVPEYIPFEDGDRPVQIFVNTANYLLPLNSTLTEVVFPNQMVRVDGFANIEDDQNSWIRFNNLRKITFGEMFEVSSNGFENQPLDTVIFSGTKVIRDHNDNFIDNPNFQRGSFSGCPATAKVIVPCGTRDEFLATFNSDNYSAEYPGYFWQTEPNVTWTASNFTETPCPSALTVLSSDIAKGHVTSFNSLKTALTWTWGDNAVTQVNHSGYAELFAGSAANSIFVGWSDGNLDNPRTVSVSSDTTFTANFATCEGSGIAEAQAASPLRVYPNPANGTLNVEMANYVNNGTLALFDLNGKVVLSQAINGSLVQISMSALSAGSYILRLVENGTASAGVQVIKN